jgi:hypothetical protein
MSQNISKCHNCVFQVDLQAFTKVEGITVWNWKEFFIVQNNYVKKNISYWFGVYQLSLSYQDWDSKWQHYTTVGFSQFTT